MSSVILKHKVQSSISISLPFPAYFIRIFTAIFYAHGITINMEVSSMESCSLLIFFLIIFCVWYLETNTMKMKSNCIFFLNISKHLSHFPSSLQWKHPQCVRLAAQSAKSSTFLPRLLRLVFFLLVLAIKDTWEFQPVFFPPLLYPCSCSLKEIEVTLLS